MGITQLNFEGKNKVEVAIMRLQEFEPPEGYYLADSGGKDSSACLHLLQMAGSKYDAHYARVGIDPPELVRFIQKYHPETIFERPEMSIFKGIEKKGLPRRQSRWCCELLKEKNGGGRTIVMGIRWQESGRRSKRGLYEVCQQDETKMFLNPIIDWTTTDVWDFIRAESVPYCKLYDEGFKRLGCVLCPMTRDTKFQIKRFPKIAEAWKRAAYRYYDKGGEGVKRWATAEDFWQWWLSRGDEPKVSEAQCIMFDN